jgi:hypothetical protein
MVTTAIPWHSPEIDYLEDGTNGLMTSDDPSAYAAVVAGLLADPMRLAQLSRKAQESAERYSLETMVANFRDGILRCLESDKKPKKEVEN